MMMVLSNWDSQYVRSDFILMDVVRGKSEHFLMMMIIFI